MVVQLLVKEHAIYILSLMYFVLMVFKKGSTVLIKIQAF